MKPRSIIITTQQLAKLADRPPAFFSTHREDLGMEAFTVPTGPQGGRPEVAYSLEDVAVFILDRTGFLTEAECRLRVALSDPKRKRGSSKMSKFLEAHCLFEADGVTHVLPRALSEISPELRAKVLAADQAERDALRARRSAARRHTTTKESLQP